MIDKTRIVSEGDVAKFKIEITHEDFDQHVDNYKVVLSWGMLGQSMTIEKNDMVTDEDENIFMVFDSTGMVGMVKATCIYDVNDSDMESGIRQEVNYQWLCFVTNNPNPKLPCDFDAGGDGHVTYTRVWRGDVHTLYLNLRTTEDNGEHCPLVDSEGEPLRVRKEEKDMN